MSTLSLLALVAAAALTAHAQSMTVVNSCDQSVFLYTQESYGSIKNKVIVDSNSSIDMGISPDWDGAINVGEWMDRASHNFSHSTLLSPSTASHADLQGTNCTTDGSVCTTGGPTWDGTTPFSRAEFNFVSESLCPLSCLSNDRLIDDKWAIPGSVTYDISLIYGYNVGMGISAGDDSCYKFSCTLQTCKCVSVFFLFPFAHST